MSAPSDTARRRAWGWPHYLALLALPILFLETWTVVSWLADGPSQITEYRTGEHGKEFWGARGFEAFAIVLSLWVISKLIKDCRAQGRLLTFDVMFCIACATLFWANGGNNFFQPMFSISSEFVNLNDTCGHNPLIVNPDCGRFANPMIFLGLFEVFGLLGCAMLLGGVARRCKERWPGLTRPQLYGIVSLGGCVLVLGEPAVLLPLNLWTFPGTPLSVSIGGEAFRYPFAPEVLVFGLWIGTIAAVRIFKDDNGLAIVERGLDRHSPRVRTGITLLAMYGVVQIATWGQSTAPMWVLGFNQQQWPAMPAHVQNGLCDSPGVTGTRYGPCPGTPGYRMPIRGDSGLPGQSP
ncbi:spirocyclase AveC family protein [Paraconexibacter sp. AEG42_29]|uniref:spirocyclase AveC family protein n=1 Tax=Paraconexibacter sp. AEG42_29 TaxID=2997339 RepID=UPI00339DA05E